MRRGESRAALSLLVHAVVGGTQLMCGPPCCWPPPSRLLPSLLPALGGNCPHDTIVHGAVPPDCMCALPLLPSLPPPIPGGNGLITDVCVPLSRLTECVLEAQRLCKSHGLLAPLVGHVGDSK